jgi:hypothetical protein
MLEFSEVKMNVWPMMAEAVWSVVMLMKAIFLILIFGMASSFARAKDNNNCDAAKAVVEQFISLELMGEGTHTSEKLDELIDYQDRDIPGWDSFELTNESEIKSCNDSGGSVYIAVAHKVFGTVLGAVSMEAIKQLSSKLPKEEISMLRLNKTSMGWKIDSPTVYAPHVSVGAAKKMLK